jgi:micrococcal nuclease
VRKFLETATGYIVVIGIIVTIVTVILYVQNRPKVRYAHLIQENVLYKVVNVLDGDTLVANVSGHEVTIRLIGMDTPEVVDPRKPVQCYGPEASVKGHELLEGKEIYLEKDLSKTYDMYGRVLAYAKFLDGELYNEKMIEEGFAREYTFNKEKYKYQSKFKAAQKAAQSEKLGLWGSCATSS